MSVFFRYEENDWPGLRPRPLGTLRHRLRYGHWPQWDILRTSGNKLICRVGGCHGGCR